MRKKEREQQKVDTAEKKVAKGPKERKFSKKQVALRFKSYSESSYADFRGYKPDFEKVWNEHIKGKRFKDNEELLKVFKAKFEPTEKQRKADKEETERDPAGMRLKSFNEKYKGKLPAKFKYFPELYNTDWRFADTDPYSRIVKYMNTKSGEKGHVEYMKAVRDYEMYKADRDAGVKSYQTSDEAEKLKKKWKKLINEEKIKRKKIKEAKGK